MKKPRYAEGTTVTVERSRCELETLVKKHGATGYASSWDRDRYCIMFDLRGRRVRFDIATPNPKEYRDQKKWDAEERRRWRVLLLVLKAKLELVASGDCDFEAEFLANLVLRDGETLGARLLPSLSEVLASGRMPPMLPRGSGQI